MFYKWLGWQMDTAEDLNNFLRYLVRCEEMLIEWDKEELWNL